MSQKGRDGRLESTKESLERAVEWRLKGREEVRCGRGNEVGEWWKEKIKDERWNGTEGRELVGREGRVGDGNRKEIGGWTEKIEDGIRKQEIVSKRRQEVGREIGLADTEGKRWGGKKGR